MELSCISGRNLSRATRCAVAAAAVATRPSTDGPCPPSRAGSATHPCSPSDRSRWEDIDPRPCTDPTGGSRYVCDNDAIDMRLDGCRVDESIATHPIVVAAEQKCAEPS